MIRRNLKTPGGRAFWASVDRIAALAENWPDSKRSLRVPEDFNQVLDSRDRQIADLKSKIASLEAEVARLLKSEANHKKFLRELGWFTDD